MYELPVSLMIEVSSFIVISHQISSYEQNKSILSEGNHLIIWMYYN